MQNRAESNSNPTIVSKFGVAQTSGKRQVASLGRPQAGKYEYNKRPKAASGGANNLSVEEHNFNFGIQISACSASAERKLRCWQTLLLGSKCKHRRSHSFAILNTLRSAHALPNPSLKLSTNSVSRQPSSARASPYFALAVQRATLSVPA